ncbi:MAG: hypothetical protein ACKOBT_06395, partial [Actinomycetota bacterium]
MVGVLAMVATLLAAVMTGSEDAPGPPTILAIDGWAPYWALDDSAAEIGRRAGSMREISPFWFKVTGVTRIETYPTAPVDLME